MNASQDGAGGRLVRHRDLRRWAKAADFRLVAPVLDDDAALLRGDFVQLVLRSGLQLHATDVWDLHDLETRAVQEPGLTFSLFLEGGVTAHVGERAFAMGRPDGRGGPVEAVVVARARREMFRRVSACGTHVRKVTVTVSPQWLEESGLDTIEDHRGVLAFSRTHLASLRWTPSPRLVSLVEQILKPPSYAPLMRNLYVESRTLDIVGEALNAVAHADIAGQERAAAAMLRPKDYARVRAVCEYVDAHLDDAVTLDTVARHVGMSVSTLQRVFRAARGTTVVDHIRARKLERAREALERDGVSVNEAAFIAGYANPANFATAFKRTFGVPPRHFRARI
ncbi:helix-turn-helix transcriptional regulator [Rhodoplanes azumiensis]|uniref:Helix-turn-helix transcriptional regulator n=1 Tax=Rhodoplanes azumiensis TaxID=1897628 RepID=A0ABW5AN90_9BRAD